MDKITGPGNAYVAAAKRQVFGRVGIDMIAGPSEVLVIADADQNPEWLAWDLLAQAEHDADAQSILITTDPAMARAVAAEVERIIPTLDRAAIAGASWRDYGTLIVVDDLDQAAALSNRIAPEHLELCVADPEGLAAKCIHAGAIFLGAHTRPGGGRLCQWPESRPAHRAVGAVQFRPVGDGFPQAHDHGAADAGASAAIGPPRCVWPHPRACRRMALRFRLGWGH